MSWGPIPFPYPFPYPYPFPFPFPKYSGSDQFQHGNPDNIQNGTPDQRAVLRASMVQSRGSVGYIGRVGGNSKFKTQNSKLLLWHLSGAYANMTE
jgi:hypothetical protein